MVSVHVAGVWCALLLLHNLDLLLVHTIPQLDSLLPSASGIAQPATFIARELR